MTAILTEVQKSDEMVKLAREQIDAFNKGDWALLRGILASDARYEEFGTERKVEGPEKIVELFKGWKTDECTQNLAAITALFEEHGIVIAPRVMSMAEAYA